MVDFRSLAAAIKLSDYNILVSKILMGFNQGLL